MTEKTYLKISEAAKILRVTPDSIRKRIKRGEMPGEKIGGVFLVPREYFETLHTKINSTTKDGK